MQNPIINRIVYTDNLLDELEYEIKNNKPSKDNPEFNKLKIKNLKRKLDLVLKERNRAFDNHLDISLSTPKSDRTIIKVELDTRGEYLIKQALDLLEILIENMI